MKEENEYILGTDEQELFRLGIQHQVWAEEAQRGWSIAGFRAGQTLLDLGCGPGFCAKELAFMVGQSGKVIGVDMSRHYIDYLNDIVRLHHLNIETIHADFSAMQLEDNSLDGMYCRWALAWLPNPKDILQDVRKALKPAGKMVIHEYYDWSTHQTEPQKEGLSKAIAAALKSFKDSRGEIDIGRKLPVMADEIGMKVISLRLMPKLGTPQNAIWNWPLTFYKSYFPRLVELGYLSNQEVAQALKDVEELKETPGATICCPLMLEVVLEKV